MGLLVRRLGSPFSGSGHGSVGYLPGVLLASLAALNHASACGLEPDGTGPSAPLTARAWAAPCSVPEAAPPPPARWSDLPVAWGLHPTHYQYGRRYQEILASTMGGPGASSVFGPVVARADAHYALIDATDEGVWLLQEDREQWQEAAIAGSLLALERLARETVERAPVLYGIYYLGDTVLSPSIDVQKQGEGLRVGHRIGGPANRNLERAEAELNEPASRRPPAPSIGTGVVWALREEDAPETAPLLRWTAWLQLNQVGLTSARLEYAPIAEAWTATGRRELWKRVSVIGSARSDDHDYRVARVSGGVMWVPPMRGSCNVRFERIVTFIEPDQRWMVSLRCENRSDIPAPLDPPLGDRGRDGPVLPWVPERGANVVEGW